MMRACDIQLFFQVTSLNNLWTVYTFPFLIYLDRSI
jgi:hypothetical protein